MVIWLFAGGGESEIRGLVPFLEIHFPACSFDRKTPVKRKPGPRPGIKPSGYGRTGKSLVVEIKERLRTALSKGDQCDVILVIDDLDCRDENEQKTMFSNGIDSVEGSADIDRFIGFAAPELEAWIIADWDDSIARHPDFRSIHEGMRHWLSRTKNIPFDAPESFGVYDSERDTCDEKMSDAIIESAEQFGQRYRKGYHTPTLLLKIDPNIVKNRCPLFRQLYSFLSDYCQNN